MKDREIDDILKQAADANQHVDPVLLDRIASSLGSNLQPVRSLPPASILATGLVLSSAAVALAGAMFFGLLGVHKMSAIDIGLIFPVLGILIWFAAFLCVAESIPGSRRPLAPWLLEVSCCAGLAVVFGLLFHDYGTVGFVSQGLKCLTAGLVLALPAALAIWLILKRGFSVNPAASGFARGTLAGLAGVTMLELHCPNFEVLHVVVWHIAVLPVSAALAVLVARAIMTHGRH